ncbi:hypothetical protein [Streptomyces clavuligerus]|uniref:Membrane attack complex component/perforin/complement C9 n=1 Tax=Streptomyces clavuligerus TaxID=1901 RepID=B5GVL1_STRCL|nr:hypothetical protein [Streptomyces clavuligerus]ANW17181.1 hypothetical protein BB341_02575 [Streptomyces clavuligerus]AXU11717.1 hypothetical protein D1794_02670 [Streptomyces clavuligerus]EDY50357.1 conserved hypothetical protein [Streptomyces clavuligerus]EFG10361.1 Membrane attack complex component/perforin/complement C9 [Streptomyces clavuligerus]MBY6301560.1 hypothetical protein [Streptomyces clavuligerus]
MTYISDLTVLDGTKPDGSDTVPPTGYTKIWVDLNSGAHGDYLYFAYATSSDRKKAITDIQFSVGDKPTPPSGYQPIDTDLNKNTGKHRKAIWALFTRDPIAGGPLTGLRVHAGQAGSTPQPPWFSIDQDLNEGADGDYVRLLYTTS